MKKSHQRSMKLAVPPCMIAVVLSISGCTFSEINKMQKKTQEDSAHTWEKASALSARKSQALTWLDNQWVNLVPVAQVSREEKQTAPACYITRARKEEVTLQELGQRITAVCGIPVIIMPDAANSTPEGGTTRQMTGILPAPDGNGRLPLGSLGNTIMTTSIQPLTLNNLMWQGNINGLLDLMVGRSGLYWRTDNGRIVSYLTETRTYLLHMLSTKTSSSPSASSDSTSTTGATGGQDNPTPGDATSSQSTIVGQGYDLYEDTRKTIEATLTPERGRYWLSASNLMLTVADTPVVQEAVVRYVDEQNSTMNHQVALNVQVLSVSNTRNEQFGLDRSLAYKSLYSVEAVLNNVSGDFTDATSASVLILDTATGDAVRFSGSSLPVKVLSEQSDVSAVISQESTVISLTPVPIQMVDQTVYVAQLATTTITDIGATTTLTPGMITTGFNMTLLPLAQKMSNLQLQMNFNLSDPPTIRSFTSKGGNSCIEMPYTKLRSLSQKVNLKEGQSLVATGFDQNNTTTSKADTFTPANPLSGDSQTGRNERSTLVITITPTFPSGGNNG